MNINSHLLGDHLKSMGIISGKQLEEALKFQKDLVSDLVSEPDINRAELITKARKKDKDIPLLGQVLLEKGFISKDLLEPVLAMQNRQVRELRLLSSEKLALVIQIGFIINSTVDLIDVLSLIMKYANIVTDAAASTLMLLDDKTGELVFSIPTGPKADELKDIRIPPGVGVAGWVAQNQQHVLVDDVKNDPRFYSRIDDMTGVETSSLLCVPMRSKRKLIGVLEVINKNEKACFTEDDALLLSIFSQQAAIAIENAILFNSVQNRQEKD
ncbi:MAG: GAF domain-containing protein [Proteobacteria bacterium]|nr:GAF domain-containing protein [Pseudomonadota bacterium]MBU1585871.1 GAF domain-containing protein [Pseudomonadota bacterium]MBU2452353.1 GAF domain-containing protein [Pseudomonadota bacterium]MBU2631815.1 GAF domain-containing protein [Pseudomonadota bacterium]